MDADDSPLTPCPVCGMPNEVCVGSSPPPTHIIGAHIFPSLGHDDVHLVEEDVYEDRTVVAAMVDEEGNEIVAPKIRRVLIAKAGDAIRVTDAQRLGILKS